MIVEITIPDPLDKTLTAVAGMSNLTEEQYATNIVLGFLRDQYQGLFLAEIKGKTTQELKALEDTIIKKPKKIK